MNMMSIIDNSIRSLFQMIAVIYDAEGEYTIVDHNRELENIMEGSSDRGEPGPFDELRHDLIKNIHPEDREEFEKFTDRDSYVKKLKKHVHVSLECRIRHSNRKYYWSEVIMCNATAEDSTEGNDCILLIRDINERKANELKREAEEREVLMELRDQYDALFEENMTDQQTGCYNRKGLKYYSDIVIDDAKENGKNVFVCVADLNGLKHLNDTYGHAAGDEAIRVVSGELTSAAPSGGKTVRIGGDEFLIFASIDKDSTETDGFAQKLDAGIDEYNRSYSNPYTVGVSYGFVLLPLRDDMTSLDEYIEMADAKMYEMRIERDKYRRK